MHHKGTFVDGEELKYVGGGVTEINNVDIDQVSQFEILGLAKDVGLLIFSTSTISLLVGV